MAKAEAQEKTVRVEAHVNWRGVRYGETGEVPDDAETAAAIERGFVSRAKD